MVIKWLKVLGHKYILMRQEKSEKNSFGACNANEKNHFVGKKTVSLARAMLGHTGLGLNDNRGHVRLHEPRAQRHLYGAQRPLYEDQKHSNGDKKKHKMVTHC